MPKCDFRGGEVLYPFTYSFCESELCMKHTLPDNHDCIRTLKRTLLGPWHAKKPPKGKPIKIPSKPIQTEKRVGSEGKFHPVKGENKKRKFKIPVGKILGIVILAIIVTTVIILPLYAVNQLSVQCFDDNLDVQLDFFGTQYFGFLNFKVRFNNNGTFDITLKNVEFTLRVLDSESNEQLIPLLISSGIPSELLPGLGKGLVFPAQSFRQYQISSSVNFQSDYQYLAVIVNGDVSFFWYARHLEMEHQIIGL